MCKHISNFVDTNYTRCIIKYANELRGTRGERCKRNTKIELECPGKMKNDETERKRNCSTEHKSSKVIRIKEFSKQNPRQYLQYTFSHSNEK